MAVPYTFATATSTLPLNELDSNFATPVTLGTTACYLGNTITTLDGLTLTNVTLSGSVASASFSNVTISSVASTFPNSFLANSSVTLGSTAVPLGSTAGRAVSFGVVPRTTTGTGDITINTDSFDACVLTSLGTATIGASGTPASEQTLWVAITKGAGSSVLTWSSAFEASGTVALPTAATNTRQDLLFVWNTATNKWRLVLKA